MKIVACAICKNEEKNIPQWLARTADFDCRIVVDTGSTDSSVALLRDAGVLVVEKKFDPFRFDDARNATLALVPEDADWVLWPDFDEYYNRNWRSELERAVGAYPWITRLTYRTFQYTGGNMVEGEESETVMDCKAHRNGMYRWEKPIHEYLVWQGSGDEAVKRVPGIVRHHMHEPSQERDRLYFEIAERGLAEHPDDAYLIWFVLKEYYYTRRDYEKGVKLARRYLDATSGNTNFRAIARAIITEHAGVAPEATAAGADSPESAVFPGQDYTFGKNGRRGAGWSGEAPAARQALQGTFPEKEMRGMLESLFKNGEDRAGIELAQVYLAHCPSDTAVTNEYAGALYRVKRFPEALAITERLARQFPEDPGISFNLAKCYQALRRPDDASKLLKQLLKKDPHNRDYALDYALYLSGEGKFGESEAVLRGLTPDDRTRFNLGWYEMRKGNFTEGFVLRDYGRSQHLWGSEHVTLLPKERRYAGGSLEGKTVFLSNEGGLGDEMIFARFAGVARERGAAHVFMGCSPGLVPVFERSLTGVDDVLPLAEAVQRSYDTYIPMMNAPSLLEISSPTVLFPYLTPRADRVAFWKEKLDALAGGRPKIGIRWAGNPKFEHEQFREIDPKLLVGLNAYGKLFSLQRDHGAELLPHNHNVHNLQHDLTDWEETLAILANLDMVVSSCTSIVHAAGAMGVPTCVIVPIAPYFIWAVPGKESDWYPSVTVFRQEKLRSWQEPIDEIYAHLARHF